MEIPMELQVRMEEWDRMSRWERSELGRDLRRLGLSYGEIMGHIKVKKSTLATWCRDITLTEAQKTAILTRTGSRAGIPVDTQWRRRLEVEAIRVKARDEARTMMTDPFWIAGVVLHWAEGMKTNRQLQLAHTEPEALDLFRRWTRTYHAEDAEFRASINLHANNDEAEARSWWADQLGLDAEADFTKSFVKPDGTGHRKNHLPHGTCRLSMLTSTDRWHVTLAWIDVMRNTHLG